MTINKLKTGIISFIFSSILGIVISIFKMEFEITRRAFMDFYILVIPLVFLGAFILTIILLFSLSKLEKKISQNSHSYSWIIKFNLIFSSILFVMSFVAAVMIVVIGGGGHPQEFGAYAMIILFSIFFGGSILTILFFSFIPQLVLFRFYSNKKLFTLISYIFLIIMPILLILFTGSVAIYSHYTDIDYVANRAAEKTIKMNDISICEEIRSTEEIRVGSSPRVDLCYYLVAKKTGDVSFCKKITHEYSKYKCVVGRSIQAKNLQVCEELKEYSFTEKGYNKEECYRETQTIIENNWPNRY